ncbi:MAG: macrolide ABC transporter ATP-binding protein, partial [FCB group bacterium]|nr:macrolide ABC transporter ATP-binding protein [FCB group bacterium]
LFKELNRQGHTIIMVTHDEATAEHADRIIQLKDGSISADRKVAEPRNAANELEALKSGEGDQ